jgi:hypothetical protein
MEWHLAVVEGINTILTLFVLVIGVIAFIHCATQRADAFPVLGTLQKPAWLAIIGASTVLALLSGVGTFGLLFNLIALAAAALYLLDVRPGLRDIADGHGSW